MQDKNPPILNIKGDLIRKTRIGGYATDEIDCSWKRNPDASRNRERLFMRSIQNYRAYEMFHWTRRIQSLGRQAREIAKAITEYTYRHDTGTRTDNWNCRSAYANRSVAAFLPIPRPSNLAERSFTVTYTADYRNYPSNLSVSKSTENRWQPSFMRDCCSI